MNYLGLIGTQAWYNWSVKIEKEFRAPGPWRDFEAPRVLGDKELTGNNFGGPAKMSINTLGVWVILLHMISVSRIEIGELEKISDNEENIEFPGVFVLEPANIEMNFKGSRAAS